MLIYSAMIARNMPTPRIMAGGSFALTQKRGRRQHSPPPITVAAQRAWASGQLSSTPECPRSMTGAGAIPFEIRNADLSARLKPPDPGQCSGDGRQATSARPILAGENAATADSGLETRLIGSQTFHKDSVCGNRLEIWKPAI